eukprot:365463-Chlamydomonas_euryale.AAC.7
MLDYRIYGRRVYCPCQSKQWQRAACASNSGKPPFACSAEANRCWCVALPQAYANDCAIT